MSEATAPAAQPEGLLAKVRLATLVLGVATGAVGALSLLAGPALYRMKALTLEGATSGIEGWAFWVFAGGLTLSVLGIGLSAVGKKSRGVIVGVLAVIVSGYGVGRLYSQSEIRSHMPPIWDAQTDWSDPVAFSAATLAERERAGAVKVADDAAIAGDNPQWKSKTFGAAQAEVYDLKPLVLPLPPADATVAAADAAKVLGWSVMRSDPQAGLVEAVQHTAWYGLATDIAIRVRPEGTGSRIDVRSTSREAAHDMGANAQRVSALLEQLAFAARGS